ncbi:hypothetical protein V8E36_003398, partial [Tilletia maclaganii]
PLPVLHSSTASRSRETRDHSCYRRKCCCPAASPADCEPCDGYAKALLQDAGLAIVSIVSPTCYNTVKGTSYGASCYNPKNIHMLRHYRPEIAIDILDKVQADFGFDTNKVVTSGASMGGRGAVRFATAYPVRAVSCMGCHLEKASDRIYQSQPWNKGNCGEGCWNLNVANINSTKKCTQRTPETTKLASKLASTQVQFYASLGDKIANYTTAVKPSCDLINAFARAGKTNGSCVIRLIEHMSATNKRPPSHQELGKWSTDPWDLNWIIAAYGGAPVKVLMGGNVTERS